MRKFFSLLLLFPLFAFSEPSDITISPKRYPNETFGQALNRIKESVPSDKHKFLFVRDTPIGKKVPVKQIDFTMVPAVATYEELMNLFKTIRDTRFLHMENDPDFERRISWLYPDDGCFARAALSVAKLDEEHMTRPVKIFAFGDLVLQTPYSSDGVVYWWYHVSTAVSYMGAVYILDPALNADRPTLADDWYAQMSTDNESYGVVCNAYTYGPFDNCYQVTVNNDDRALKDESRYLDLEWDRISSLGFDPIALLGNTPPWIIDVQE